MDTHREYIRRDISSNDTVIAIQYTGDNVQAIKSFCPKSMHSNDKNIFIKGKFIFSDKEYEDGFFAFDKIPYGKRFLNKNQWILKYDNYYYIHDDHRFKILFKEA